MSHELNELALGVHSFAGREHGWHRLGTEVGHTMTAVEALEAAHLARWDVRKVDIVAKDDKTSGEIKIDNRFATVYTNPVTGATQYLGVVGNTYTPIQNEANADLLNAIVDESGAHFETAGSLRGGRETFITMKMPETIMFGGKDATDLYLVAVNSHDASSAFRFIVTPVRIVCANTLSAAIAGAKSSFSIRHTKGANAYIQEAREALSLTFSYFDQFQAEAEKMIEKTLTDKAFEKIAARLFDLDIATTTRARNKATEHVSGVVDLFRNSPTLDGIRNTRWAGYNAITEYVDHFASVRSVGGRDAADARAQRAVTGTPALALKDAAFASFSRAVLA